MFRSAPTVQRNSPIKCHICDKDDDLITYDKKRGEFTACGVCEAVIQECVDSYEAPEEGIPLEG